MDAHAEEEFDPEYATERTTAPQGRYTMRDVAVGAAIALAGLVVTFAIPILGTV